ncbi:PREDICTED: E3 ubiquitin-protein ligase TRIM13 [Cyprinodon variegatus]|uniref:Tripartite motif containing 13 n=1 Tax=Cyprinodon variegatus TaxID=28743 RepID=A0A3Q2FIG6_CYPVA|nr:PREDICTED: E3 ubiquitin-protein ligase TRIM13 [Cyprinodon variegatus]XP_015238779.1 PREDICTED: E3 ubiquitin-protein ligase TRIM13 [Cyprinodon variegatus]
MEQLQEELTCPVCCGVFEDPRMLLCSHSFCKKCLEDLLEANRGPAFRTPLKCPTCRKETPHNGSNSLQINYSLRGIVDKFSKIKAMPRTSDCKQHCGQPLNMFCSTDLRLICGICATTDEHKGHDFSSLEDAYEQEKGAFAELRQEAENWHSADTRSCLETLQGSKKKTLQSVSRDAGMVAEYFDKLTGSLECKKSEILSDFETLKLVVMQAYDPEISKLTAALEEHSRALELVKSFRRITDPVSFLQQMQEFRQKLKVVKETPLPSGKDMDVGPHVRNFDVKKWDSLRLGEIDKISVPHECGSYQTGGAGKTLPKWLVLIPILFLSTLIILFLSMQYSASDLSSNIQALINYYSQTVLYIHEICKDMIDEGLERMLQVRDAGLQQI